MKIIFILKMAIILGVLSILFILPSMAFAQPGVSAAFDKSAKFAKADGLKDLNDYMDDYNGVSDKMKKATNLYISGLIEYQNGDNKEAKKDFEKSNKKFKESDNDLSDLEPPGSAKRLHELTENALNKYIDGTKTSIKAMKSNNVLQLGEAATTMAQGVELESQAVAEVGLVVEKLIEGAVS